MTDISVHIGDISPNIVHFNFSLFTLEESLKPETWDEALYGGIKMYIELMFMLGFFYYISELPDAQSAWKFQVKLNILQ